MPEFSGYIKRDERIFMIDDIRWLLKADGKKVLQANDGHVWFEIDEVIEE